MNAYLNAMRRYFDFKTRATRTEFWMFTLVMFLGGIVAFIFDLALGNAQNGPPFITALWMIAHYIPALAVAVRRLHDIDRTGWWVLIGIIPIGALVLIIFYCQASTSGANRFGGASTGAGVVGDDRAGQAMASMSAQQARSATALAGDERSVAPSAQVPLAELERLAALRASGVIDDAEFITFALAGLIAFAGSAAFPDLQIWGFVALAMASMAFFAWRSGKKKAASVNGKAPA